MIFDFVDFYPLRETIETFTHIYCGLIDGIYEKEYLNYLVNLSEIFYKTLCKVLVTKEILKQKNNELESGKACELTRLVLENEIFSLNHTLDHLMGKDAEFSYDESCTEASQEILQFYFDAKEAGN